MFTSFSPLIKAANSVGVLVLAMKGSARRASAEGRLAGLTCVSLQFKGVHMCAYFEKFNKK